MMSPRLFVVDEWLIYDLKGENGRDKQVEAQRFLERLIERCDRMAVPRSSPWMKKVYSLMEHPDALRRRLSKQLHLRVLRDPCKCLLLNPEERRRLPEDLEDGVPEDDRYLVETYLSAGADLFVTTDRKLYDRLSSAGGVSVRLRDDFLKEYLEE